MKNKEMFKLIPNTVHNLNKIFKNSGKDLFLVGGAVRDFINGDEPKDFDLATDATPKEMIDMFITEFGLEKRITDKDGNDKEFNLNNGIKLNLQGAHFGVLVVYNLVGVEEGVEIATFREDLTSGRNPEIKMGVTIEDDVKRRDITFNGLFYNLDTGELIDLVGGVDDLINKVVRMVGNAVDRIQEDKLRILRVIRFATRYNSIIHDETIKAIKNDNVLTDVSQERIWEEFNKSFKQSKSFKHYLDFITDFDMWSEVFPDINVTVDGYKETDNIAICLAQIFRGNNSNDVRNKMVKVFEAPSKLADMVKFILDLKDFDVKKLATFVRTRERFFIDHDTVAEWFKIAGLNSPEHNSFIGFEPNVSSREVIEFLGIKLNAKGNPSNGVDGQRLGVEINKRIINQFNERM